MSKEKKNKKKEEEVKKDIDNKEVEQKQEESVAKDEMKEEDAAVLMEKQCAELQQKVAESADKYIRLAAEFDNFRRRSAKERLDLINTAGEDIIKGFLPIMDDCERALQVLKESDANDAAKEGTALILNKLFGYLKSRGVDRIDAAGKELDTDFHEAVAQFPVEDKDKKNKIIDIVQQGYTLHGKVIRYAKVVVGV